MTKQALGVSNDDKNDKLVRSDLTGLDNDESSTASSSSGSESSSGSTTTASSTRGSSNEGGSRNNRSSLAPPHKLAEIIPGGGHADGFETDSREELIFLRGEGDEGSTISDSEKSYDTSSSSSGGDDSNSDDSDSDSESSSDDASDSTCVSVLSASVGNQQQSLPSREEAIINQQEKPRQQEERQDSSSSSSSADTSTSSSSGSRGSSSWSSSSSSESSTSSSQNDTGQTRTPISPSDGVGGIGDETGTVREPRGNRISTSSSVGSPTRTSTLEIHIRSQHPQHHVDDLYAAIQPPKELDDNPAEDSSPLPVQTLFLQETEFEKNIRKSRILLPEMTSGEEAWDKGVAGQAPRQPKRSQGKVVPLSKRVSVTRHRGQPPMLPRDPHRQATLQARNTKASRADATVSLPASRHLVDRPAEKPASQSLPPVRRRDALQRNQDETATTSSRQSSRQRLEQLESLLQDLNKKRSFRSIRELVAMDIGDTKIVDTARDKQRSTTDSLAVSHLVTGGGAGETTQYDLMLLHGLEALLGALVNLSDELELIAVFQQKKSRATIKANRRMEELANATQAEKAYNAVLVHTPSLDRVFSSLQPILQYFVEVHEPTEIQNVLLARAQKIVQVLCDMTYLVSHRQAWDVKEETAFSTLLELLEATADEIVSLHDEVPLPEYHVSEKLEGAWTASGHLEELKALNALADRRFFRRLCFEVLLDTANQCCPDPTYLADICGAQNRTEIEDRSRISVEEKSEGKVAPIPQAISEILDGIRDGPLPRPMIIACILRRLLPPNAIENNSLTDKRSTASLRNLPSSDNTKPVIVSAVPEDPNDSNSLGIAGVGKTTLVAMVASRQDVRRFFRDGVTWLRVGSCPLNYVRYTMYLKELLSQLPFYDGDFHFPELIPIALESSFEMKRREEGFMVYARDLVADLLRSRRVLIILDDVHFSSDLYWFHFQSTPPSTIQRAHVVNGDSNRRVVFHYNRILLTSRCRHLLGPDPDSVDVDLLTEMEATQLLLSEAGFPSKHVVHNAKEVKKIVRECAGHPLAIKAVGRWLRLKQASSGVISSVEELEKEIERSIDRAGSRDGESSMLFQIMDAALSPLVAGEQTKIIKACFASFLVVFDGDQMGLGESSRVPLCAVALLFESLLTLEEWSSLFARAKLFHTHLRDTVALIPEALAALGVLRIVDLSTEHDSNSDCTVAGSDIGSGEDVMLNIAHFVHKEYGEYLLNESPELADLTKDAFRDWNSAFAQTCLKCDIEWDGDSHDPLRTYANEFLVVHLLRAGLCQQAASLLMDESFARGRVFVLGREDAACRCIRDCETLHDLLSEQRMGHPDVNPRKVMKRSYRTIGKQILPNHAGLDARERHALKIEAGRSYINMATSLAGKRCWEDAIAHWNRARDIFTSVFGLTELVAALLYTTAVGEAELGRFDDACAHLDECLKIRQTVHGDRHFLYAKTIQKFADIDFMQGNLKDATNGYTWALDVMESPGAGDEVCLDICEIRVSLGKIHMGRGEQAEALKCFQQALNSKLHHFGRDHLEVASAYENMGDCLSNYAYYEESLRLNQLSQATSESAADALAIKGVLQTMKGNFDDALDCYNESLEIVKAKIPHDFKRLAVVLWRSGQVYVDMNDDERAQAVFQQCLQLQSSLRRCSPLDTSRTLLCIADLHEKSGRPRDCLKYLKKVLKLQQVCVPNSFALANTCHKMAVLYRVLGKNKRAIGSYEEAVRIRRFAYGSSDEVTGAWLQELGDVRFSTGDYTNSFTEYQDALKMRRETSEIDQEAIASSLYSLGCTAYHLGEVHEAISLLQDCLNIQKTWYGEASIQVGGTLSTLGSLKKQIGELDEATCLLNEASAIHKSLGNMISFSDTLLIEGKVLRQKGSLASAIEKYTECLEIRKSELGNDHEKVVDAVVSIADVRCEQGRVEESIEAYKEARSILVSVFGRNDGRVADVMMQLGSLEFRYGDMRQAKNSLEESLRIRKTNGKTKGQEYEDLQSLLVLIIASQGNPEEDHASWTDAQIRQRLPN